MNITLLSSQYQTALKVIYSVIAELNLQRPRVQQIQQAPECVLFGAQGQLDSLDIANFIVLTEQLIHENFGISVDLTENDAFSVETGHMRTVDSLATHISHLVHQQSSL